MLRQESVSTKLAKIARIVDTGNAGYVTEDGLDLIMRGLGVDKVTTYKTKLVDYGYLTYDPLMGGYRATPESKAHGTITVTVAPSLFAEEVRRHLVATLAGYPDLIRISDVEL